MPLVFEDPIASIVAMNYPSGVNNGAGAFVLVSLHQILVYDASTQGELLARPPIAAGQGQTFLSAAASDVNCDGFPDLLVALRDDSGNAQAPSGVEIFLNDGTGNLQLAQDNANLPIVLPLPTATGSMELPSNVFSQDYDGDGTPDLIVGSALSTNLFLFHNVSQ
jgi:hypothetical protein